MPSFRGSGCLTLSWCDGNSAVLTTWSQSLWALILAFGVNFCLVFDTALVCLLSQYNWPSSRDSGDEEKEDDKVDNGRNNWAACIKGCWAGSMTIAVVKETNDSNGLNERNFMIMVAVVVVVVVMFNDWRLITSREIQIRETRYKLKAAMAKRTFPIGNVFSGDVTCRILGNIRRG